MIRSLQSHFPVDTEKSVLAEDFARVWIGDPPVKVEWINDVPFKAVDPIDAGGIPVDHPVDILANKLSALMNREEPKDMIDIKTIAVNYRFNWADMFTIARKKALVDEVDVAEKMASFPTDWLGAVVWTGPADKPEAFSRILNTLVNDFLRGDDNSIGASKPDIYSASPRFRPAG